MLVTFLKKNRYFKCDDKQWEWSVYMYIVCLCSVFIFVCVYMCMYVCVCCACENPLVVYAVLVHYNNCHGHVVSVCIDLYDLYVYDDSSFCLSIMPW